MMTEGFEKRDAPHFDRSFFQSPEPIMRIGGGELGGKAQGLLLIRELLASKLEPSRYPGIEVCVPKMVVLATDLFDAFIARNGLEETALSDLPDERIARAFMQAEFPAEAVGDLRALVQGVHRPLAVRSSSLLEDALLRPFAGVYETKMVPNNQPDADTRFLRLVEAVKFVYASTYFKAAKSYIRATDKTSADEKMAVIVQEVVGERHNERFYPTVSGVGRSYNFFPFKGVAPSDGVVNLALGLGKTIVDGGVSWIYTPTRPKAPPPYGSARDVLRYTQLDFWAVNMGEPSAHDPIAETEYLLKSDLAAADYDDTLRNIASTYDPQRDRLVPGTGPAGPRAVNFAPLLASPDLPFNDLVRDLLELGRQAVGEAVEIEFAMTFPRKGVAGTRFGFLQLRPMLVSEEEIEFGEEEMVSPDLLLASDRAMGNGDIKGIRDIVYVRPESFEAKNTPAIAAQLERINRPLLEEGRRYMLIGFGRWGSSDPWLGIQVNWGQIAGAKVIVESTLASMNVELSQGAHFFQNIISFSVCYLCVRHEAGTAGRSRGVNWKWLDGRPAVSESEHVRHIRLDDELRIKVDGRSGRGAVWLPVQV